jgi:acetyltransferase-like isoleucine patch superfamily enzyme
MAAATEGQLTDWLRESLKRLARGTATVVVSPMLASYFIRSRVIGRDRALEGSTQLLALIPGIIGEYLRRAFLIRTISRCSTTCVIGFGTLLSQTGAQIDDRVYIGPRCHLGLVHLEADVMLAAGVHIPSGSRTHGTDTRSRMRDQPIQRRLVRVGQGSWIGSNAVVLDDVGRDAIIGAGAVVTHPVPDRVLAAGVPARVILHRTDVAS